MPLPSLNAAGDLPIGVHQASLPEVLARFGAGSPQRLAAAGRLERVYGLAHGTGDLARFVVFGSFVTAKPDPNDVDVFMVMHDSFDAASLRGEPALVFDHTAADAHFGASVFWLRRLAALRGEQTTIEYWQMKRGGGRRGIVEIVESAS